MKVEHQDTTGDKHTYHLGEQLTEHQQQEICALMESYPDVLAVTFEELQKARTNYHHHIDTGDSKPIKLNAYHLPLHHKQWVRDEIKELLHCGII